MKWYQVKARLERTQEDGTMKKVTENYLTKAPSFGAAEAAVQKEVAQYGARELDIVAVTRKDYAEVITSSLGKDIADRWYKCKVNFITINERNDKEVKTSRYFLVQAASTLTAHKAVDDFMSGTLSDYEIEQVEDTKTIDVL